MRVGAWPRSPTQELSSCNYPLSPAALCFSLLILSPHPSSPSPRTPGSHHRASVSADVAVPASSPNGILELRDLRARRFSSSVTFSEVPPRRSTYRHVIIYAGHGCVCMETVSCVPVQSVDVGFLPPVGWYSTCESSDVCAPAPRLPSCGARAWQWPCWAVPRLSFSATARLLHSSWPFRVFTSDVQVPVSPQPYQHLFFLFSDDNHPGGCEVASHYGFDW